MRWADARQPILEVSAVNQAQPAEASVTDQVAGSTDHRVAAVGQRDRRMATRPAGDLDEGFRAGSVGRDRLLDDDVLARLQGGACQLDVGVVRRADMHDVDGRIAQSYLEPRHRSLDSQCPGGLRPALGITIDQRDDLPEAAPADRIDVVRTDESGPDDRAPDGPTRHVHHAPVIAGSVGITERKKATPVRKPSSTDRRASSCSIDTTSS